MFKHFCSFLTNLLTSILKFDDSGFAGSTSGKDGNAFNSGIVSQFAGAMGVNKNNWQKLTGSMSQTIGFRRFGEMAKRFNPFDNQGNLSFRTALQSIPNVKKGFDVLRKQGKFESLKNRDERKKEFLQSRKEARKLSKDYKGLNNMVESSDKTVINNMNKFINGGNSIIDKKAQQIKKQEIVRYKNSLVRQIDELYTSYNDSLDNGADKEQIAELKYKLEEVTRMAVGVNLIDEKKRNDILSGNMQSIDKITNKTGMNKFELHRFHDKKNVDTIVNLSKLAQQGLIDASLFTDQDDDTIERWASGKITTGEYDRVIKYIKAHDSINKINSNLEYASRDNLSFNDLMMYEAVYVDESYKDKKNQLRAKHIEDVIRNRQNVIQERMNIKSEIEKIEQQKKQEEEKMLKEIKEVQIGLSDKDIELSPEEVDVAALVDTEFEKSFEEKCDLFAGTENSSKANEEKALTGDEEDALKHGESILKILNLGLNIEELNKTTYEKEKELLKLELSLSTKSYDEKSSIELKISELDKKISKSEETISGLEAKKNKVDKRLSELKDKQQARSND